MAKHKNESPIQQISMNTFQRIEALKEAIKTKGRLRNKPISMLLSAFSCVIIIDYLINNGSSYISNLYQQYLIHSAENDFSNTLQQSGMPLANKLTSEFNYNSMRLVEAVNEINSKEIVDTAVSQILQPLFNKLQQHYLHVGNELKADELLDLLDKDNRGYMTDIKEIVRLGIQKFAWPYEQPISPHLATHFQQMNVKESYEFLKRQYKMMMDLAKVSALSKTIDFMATEHVQKAGVSLTILFTSELNKIADYYLRARFIPEVSGLFLTHFFVIKPYLDRRYPAGIFKKELLATNKDYKFKTENEGIKAIKELENEYINVSKEAKRISTFFGFLLAMLYSLYFLSPHLANSPFYWFFTINLSLVTLFEWVINDPFSFKFKKLQANVIINSKLISELVTQFGIKCSFQTKMGPSSACVNLRFDNFHFNDTKYNKNDLCLFFKDLFKKFKVEIEFSYYKDEMSIPLSQSTASFEAISQIPKSRIIELLAKEIDLKLLFSQIKKLDNFPYLLIDCQLLQEDSLEKSYWIKAKIPIGIQTKVAELLPDQFRDTEELNLTMRRPFPEIVLVKLLAVFDTYFLSQISTPRFVSNSTVNQLPASVKKTNVVYTDSKEVIQPISSSAKITKILKWKSGTFNSTVNNNISEVENGFGRHYTLRLFTESDCPPGTFLALKRVVSDKPKFVGDREKTGLKRKKGWVKNLDGELVPATRKAKILGVGIFGKVRIDAYEETTSTGERLHIFTAKNIGGH